MCIADGPSSLWLGFARVPKNLFRTNTSSAFAEVFVILFILRLFFLPWLTIISIKGGHCINKRDTHCFAVVLFWSHPRPTLADTSTMAPPFSYSFFFLKTR
jgi:hypothetical protein